MEYDSVQLVNDFITEEKIKKKKEEKGEFDLSKMNEEINLLYVAITRTKNTIYIPEALVPFTFPRSPHIHITKAARDEKMETEPMTQQKNTNFKANMKVVRQEKKAYLVEEARKKHKDAYTPWTPVLDDELTVMYCEGKNVKVMTGHFCRTTGAIESRIKKLELKKLYY